VLNVLQLFGSAPIVYRLGQEILILQSGVRFPVGAPNFTSDGQDRTSDLPDDVANPAFPDQGTAFAVSDFTNSSGAIVYRVHG
jgi:hypothetical protein